MRSRGWPPSGGVGSTGRHRRTGALALVLVALAVGALPACTRTAPDADRFYETTVLSGLTNPMVTQFAPDGRIFVAEKSGIIKVFSGFDDTTPTVFADLRTKVHNFWDRGLVGMVLDPAFPTRPYVYVLYVYDAAIGATAPRWGTAGETFDPCPTPPGPVDAGCVVSGRLSRLTASGDVSTGSEKVLLNGWCQQFPSHTVDTLNFGADGALYVSAGEGGSFLYADWGQAGNPCGDPPGGRMDPPRAEGGALRSQDLRTAGDPVGLSGSILRLDPDTGAAAPGNPMYASSDANTRRIIAYGLRNPFRFTFRPGTNELYLGDVGGAVNEEINQLTAPTDAVVENFGWPCYEGAAREATFDGADLNICEGLYGQGAGAVTPPLFEYPRRGKTIPGDPCPINTASVSGLAFYEDGPYPAVYDGALFFSDYSRGCMWVLMKGADGRPDPANVYFFRKASNPIDLRTGPGGDLYYLDFNGGRLQRISYSANRLPVARLSATPTAGPSPLPVSFDGSASSDPDPGDVISYAWDLDDDGSFDDSTSATTSWTYASSGVYTARLKVTDSRGATNTASQQILVDNSAPQAVIDTPAPTLRWKVGDTVAFRGHATDAQQGTLPASALTWELILHHCPTAAVCHEHGIQSYPGVTTGSFVAPDHAYPSYLELRLTAQDATGLQSEASVRLDPQTVALTVTSSPNGVLMGVGEGSATTPFTKTVVVGSNVQVSAPLAVQIGGTPNYEFVSWSDGGAATHVVTAPSVPFSLKATYRSTSSAPGAPPAGNPPGPFFSN